MKRGKRYYEAFINDEDQEVILEVPEDFPDWAPKEAYRAYIEVRCDGHEEWWNARYFDFEYEGEYDSMEDFVKQYYESEEVLRDSYDSLYDDPFFECVDLYTMGKEVYHIYEADLDALYEEYNNNDEDDASAFIGDDDESPTSFLDSLSDRKRKILDYIGKNAEDEWDYEGIAKGYIDAISELDDIPFRYVVFNFPNSDSFINYEDGINDLFGVYGNFAYKDGFVFNVG